MLVSIISFVCIGEHDGLFYEMNQSQNTEQNKVAV
jgi:hypothetical protein